MTEARAASNWWADKLASLDFDHRTADLKTALRLNYRTERLRQAPPFNEDNIESFRTTLEKLIKIATPPSGFYRHIVCNLRRPDNFLDIALDMAGIEWQEGLLPSMTVMVVQPGSVRVKMGTHSIWETLLNGDVVQDDPKNGWLVGWSP